MFTSLPDSPQSVGDIVGIACRLVRNNIKQIFNFLLVPTIFATLAGVVFQWILTYGTASISQSKSTNDALMLGGLWLVGGLVLAIAWWVLACRLLALTRFVLGFSPTLIEATQNLYRKKWRVLGVYLLGLLLLVAAVLAFGMIPFLTMFAAGPSAALPNGAALAVFIVGTLLSSVIYLIASHVAIVILACEEESAVVVLGRALSLVFRHFWRSMLFGIIFAITYMVIGYPLGLPIVILSLVDLAQHGLGSGEGLTSSFKPALYVLVLAQVWESIMGMYLRPFVVFAFGLFYYDMRLRSEGLDIRRRMEVALPDSVATEH